MALKRGRVRQHGKAGSTSGLVGLGKRGRIEVGTNEPLGGRGFLDFGNQRIFAVLKLAADRPDKTARRGSGFRQGLDARKRMGALGGRDLLALVGLDSR